jgi:peptidoglycan/LPS O-acetylase OafA/YrhL
MVMKKIEGIDGLRAIAVIAVILFHNRILDLGWVGVWIFFGISGFVITISLSSSLIGDSISSKMKVFYIKRVLRIAPLYLLLIVFSIPFIVLNHQYIDHIPYLLTATYNFYRISPYYQNTDLFGHYWSLCVEEQFYFIYPVLFFALSARQLRRLLIAIIVVAPAVRYATALSASAVGMSQDHVANAVYQFSPGHFDAFAGGCLIALERHRVATSAWLRRHFGWLVAAGAAILVAYILINIHIRGTPLHSALAAAFSVNVQGETDQILLYSMLNIMTCLLIIGILCRVPYVVQPLSNLALNFIGKISYGIYMIHLPLLAIYRGGLRFVWGEEIFAGGIPWWTAFAAYLLILFVLSVMSFRYFESYFLSKQAYFAERIASTQQVALNRHG